MPYYCSMFNTGFDPGSEALSRSLTANSEHKRAVAGTYFIFVLAVEQATYELNVVPPAWDFVHRARLTSKRCTSLHYGLTVKSRQLHGLMLKLLHLWFPASYLSQLGVVSSFVRVQVGPDLLVGY